MKISRTCAASSVNTIDNFMQTLNSEVEQAGIQFMVNDGWDQADARDYFSCKTRYVEDSNMIEVAVGAELGFDQLMELAETLNDVINKYDENAYFDAEDAGRLSAYLEVPQDIEMCTVTGASDSTSKLVKSVDKDIKKAVRGQDVDVRTRYDKQQGGIVIEVGCDYNYSQSLQLADKLTEVIRNYDQDASFYVEVPGMITGYLDPNGNFIEESTVLGAEDDFELTHVDQEYDSAATSINSKKLPAIYNMVEFHPGELALDYDGGKFDNAVNYLKDKDVTLLVYDPYNRTDEHNKEVLSIIRDNKGVDVAVCSNVLNVIKEPEARINVLQNIKRLVKSGGDVYITVYEGTGNGNEGPTKSGYQLNRKTVGYMEEVQSIFPNAERHGKLIHATNTGGTVNSATDVTAASQYNEYWHDRQRGYSVHYTSIDSNPEADPQKMLKDFKAQVSKVSPYDDAHYYWAKIENGDISIIYDGKVVDKAYYFDADDMGCENSEWADMVCQGAMDILDKYNADIQKKMIYNSEDIMGYYDNVEPQLDPPDDPDYIEKDDYQDEIDFEFDTNIFVAANGNYDVEDDNKVFIDHGEYEKSQSYYSDEFGEVYLCDTGDCITNLLEKIETLIPAQRGMYHIHGYITFVYDVEGVIAYPHKGRYEDDYYEDIDTSGARSTYNEEETEVKDFTIQPLPHQRVQKK